MPIPMLQEETYRTGNHARAGAEKPIGFALIGSELGEEVVVRNAR